MDCVDIKVGFACNNDCLHCVTADKRVFGDLTTEGLMREIEHYRAHTDAVLVITGGEPTIRDDLVELVQFARGIGFTRIQLQTHARAASDPALAEGLADAGLTSALVALHAPNAEAHDAITRAPGGFLETTAGMRNLLQFGFARSVFLGSSQAGSQFGIPFSMAHQSARGAWACRAGALCRNRCRRAAAALQPRHDAFGLCQALFAGGLRDGV